MKIDIIIEIVVIVVLILFIHLSMSATEYHNVGEWINDTIWEDAKNVCGDKPFLFTDSTCNMVYSYCASYWYPVYIIEETNCIGMDKMHLIWIWEIEKVE